MAEHQDHLAGVVTYYDTHPINEQQILHALQERGVDLDGQALPREVVDDVQGPEDSTRAQGVRHEVHRLPAHRH